LLQLINTTIQMKHLTIAERTKKTEHCNLLTPQQLRNLISIVCYYKENLFERHQRENGLSATIKSTTDIIDVLEDLNLSL